MMKQIIAILFMCMGVLSGTAQQMRHIFINLPDSIEPLLTKVNREDCVDFIDSNMKAEVKNRFDRSSELKVLTDDYLQMQLTDISTLELKLLPVNDSVNIIGLIKTVCASACDSHIRFFDTSWKELDTTEFFQLPSENVFYSLPDSIPECFEEVRSKADAYLAKMSFSSKDTSLVITYTTPDYLNKDNREQLDVYLRKQPIVLEWKNHRFSR